MNVQPNLRMDKARFLAWAEAREGRYELVESRVVMMTGGSRGHGRIVRRLAAALEARIDRKKWEIWTSDFALDLGPATVRYPDLVVDVAGGSLKDLTATAPTLVAEVLSPTSVKIDLRDKAADYLQLPSVTAYLVLSQDVPKVWGWLRGAGGFPAEPKEFSGHEAVIELAGLAIALPLSEIYSEMATG